MAEKVLKSIKFPQLPDNYNIIQMIPEFDPNNQYSNGDVCVYDGSVYLCTYVPTTEYDPTGIFGEDELPGQSDYWAVLPYPLYNLCEDYNYLRLQYSPNELYSRGQFIYYDGVLWYCIKDTPNPAGEFDYSNWVVVFDSMPMSTTTGTSINDGLTQLSQDIRTATLLTPQEMCNVESFEPTFTIERYDSDGYVTFSNEFQFAIITMELIRGQHYIFCQPLHNFYDLFYSVNDFYKEEQYEVGNVTPPLYNEIFYSFKSVNIDDFNPMRCVRLPTDYTLDWVPFESFYEIDKINIAISGVAKIWDEDSEEYINQTEPIDTDILDHFLDTLQVYKIKVSDNLSVSTKNDPMAVQQFINIARSYKKAASVYQVAQPTFLQSFISYPTDSNLFNIDASTFVQCCLKGLEFDNTPYSANMQLPHYHESDEWPVNESAE